MHTLRRDFTNKLIIVIVDWVQKIKEGTLLAGSSSAAISAAFLRPETDVDAAFRFLERYGISWSTVSRAVEDKLYVDRDEVISNAASSTETDPTKTEW